MRAITQDAYGPVEVLRLADLPRPVITGDQVLVEVRCRRARPRHLARHARQALRSPAWRSGCAGLERAVPGLDLAGTVVEVGGSVTGWSVGDEVFGIGKGSFAEYAAADPAKLAPAPGEPDRRAGRRRAGLRAAPRWQALTRAGRRARPASGCWSPAPPAASARTPCSSPPPSAPRSPRSAAPARPTWCARWARRTSSTTRPTTWPTAPGGTTSSSTSPATPPLTRLRRVLLRAAPSSSWAARAAGALAGGLGRPIWGALTSLFRKQKVVMFLAGEKGADLVPITELIESGQVTPASTRRTRSRRRPTRWPTSSRAGRAGRSRSRVSAVTRAAAPRRRAGPPSARPAPRRRW